MTVLRVLRYRRFSVRRAQFQPSRLQEEPAPVINSNTPYPVQQMHQGAAAGEYSFVIHFITSYFPIFILSALYRYFSIIFPLTY